MVAKKWKMEVNGKDKRDEEKEKINIRTKRKGKG
jgi:hypothetical protein